MYFSSAWWRSLFPSKTANLKSTRHHRIKRIRSAIEYLEDRIAPALITIDTSALVISDSSTAGGAHTFNGTPYAAHWTDNGQVAEFDFAGSFTVSADDTVVLAGGDTRAVRLVISGDAVFAGIWDVSASKPVEVTVAGTFDMMGTMSLAGPLTVTATRLEINGNVHASTVTFTGDELLNLTPDATIATKAGGSISLSSHTIINSGVIQADGVQGGKIEISAANIQNSGSIVANGLGGAGGDVSISFTEGYIETRSGLVSANGAGGAGGKVLIDGNFGHLFTSGRQEARGTTGGDIRLLAGEINVVAGSEDVSGTAGDGGTIIVYAVGDAEYAGTLIARGVTAGGFIEVSAQETLTYAGVADSGASAGPNGTLLLDPKNLTINATTGTLPQFSFVDPHPNDGGLFGNQVIPLSTGNVLVTDTADNVGGSNSGAVYLFNGRTGALISSLVGGNVDDQLGLFRLYNDFSILNPIEAFVPLENGNIVFASPAWNGGRGAVTWMNGTTGLSGIVSSQNSLIGTSPSDAVGYTAAEDPFDLVGNGIVALTNGNYVVPSTRWNGNRGAVTWGNGAIGTVGQVSASNSLVGSAANDAIGNNNVIALPNGNYVVDSDDWNGGRGAVTWGDGTTGVFGPVSTSNSLTGSNPGDRVGYGRDFFAQTDAMGTGIHVLEDGDFLVLSLEWSSRRGAVTFVNGETGLFGPLSSSNSLVGATANDSIGNGFDYYVGPITELSDGSYVVSSPSWGGGKGAVTWGNGDTGVSGAVSATNSLVGSSTTDRVGSGISSGGLSHSPVLELSNGNYVVASPNWGGNKGAVTWVDDGPGMVGTVSTANSLTGPTAGDKVGSDVTPLPNGNYVVGSPFWNGGRGASTLADGNTGLRGTVTSSNSLVGSNSGDNVGYWAQDLGNGNYVVSSTGWNGNRGAATWVNGTTGLVAAVSSTNSLVGSHANDRVGSVRVLEQGNYVVAASNWNNNAGAVTWADGTTGKSGVVSSDNSLIGLTAGDQVGSEVYPLKNGNYVVLSRNWSNFNGAVTWGSGTTGVKGNVTASNSLTGFNLGGLNIDFRELSSSNYLIIADDWNNGRGSVTWASGSGPTVGTVSAANSLVGTLAGDQVGAQITTLSNGNYLVQTSFWNGNRGAVTWGNGDAGVRGQVSSANSFLGTQPGDSIGYGNTSNSGFEIGGLGFHELSNGYMVVSTAWDGYLGAVTWFDSTTGRSVDGVNSVTPQNSLIGQRSSNVYYFHATEDAVNHTIIADQGTDGGGRVVVGLTDPDLATFGWVGISDVTIAPSFLTRTLNTGTSVVLQANNDIRINSQITVDSPITLNNPTGNGGNLTLQAGRSILFAAGAGITTDNGNLTLIANELPTNGALAASRDGGPANILVPANAPLNVGTGTLTVIMRETSGVNLAGTATVSSTVTAATTVSSTTTAVVNNGPSPSTAGEPVSLKVTVTPAVGAALNGTTVNIVDLDNNNAVVATPTLVAGTVTFTVPSLAVGTHHLVAVFAGDTGHLNSQSGSLIQIVNPDTVLTSPLSQTVNVGSNVTFTTLSALPLIDQVRWQVSTNGGQAWQPSSSAGLPTTLANSAASTTLSFATTPTQNGYQYRSVFTNAVYSIDNPLTSDPAALTVNDTITLQPADQAVQIGQVATFTAGSGYPSDLVRWQVSSNLGGTWTDLPGATSTTLTLSSISPSMDGNEYRAVFTPPAGTPTDPSRTAILNGQTVLLSNPAFLTFDGITQQPVSQNFAQTVSFTASSVRPSNAVQWLVSTNGGQSYQPLSDAGPYSGTHTPTLTITGTTVEMLDNMYKAVFSNSKFTLETVAVGLIPAALYDSDPAPNNVAQGAPAGLPIGLTVSSGLNNGSGLSYTLIADADGRFVINATSGVITVGSGPAINVLDQSYVIQAKATDPSGNSAVSEFTITVVGTPPAKPVDQNNLPNSVIANSLTGTPVGITAVASDPNPVTYSLSDDAGGRFQIDSQTGVVTVLSGTQITYPNTYSISVLATGVGGTSSSSFTVVTNSSDPSAITIGGYSLLNPVVSGTSISGTANLPIVGSVTLSGTVIAGQYQLHTSSLSNFSIDGFSLSNPVFTLKNTGLTLAGSFNGLPVLGTVQVSGAFNSLTDFAMSLTSALPSIGGLTLSSASIIPSPSGLGVTANVNLPLLGTVPLSGTIVDATHYELTTTLPSITVNGKLLANATIKLTASGLSVSGAASLPLIGTIPLTGTLQSGQYTLTANLPQLAVAGYTLTGAVVTLNSSGISLTGNASLPLVNNVTLTGTIQDATQFSMSASVPNLSVAGFTVTQAIVTLGPTGLTLEGTANLPLVGNVNLTGTISANGSCSLTANVPNLPPIAGFQLTGVKVTLTNTTLGLSGTANLPLIGNVQMSGLIADANHYSVSFSPPSLDLGGGFSLSDDVRVTLSSAGLSVVGNATLPVLGAVGRLQGKIQDATHFSLTAPLPNLGIGQFSLSDATVGLVAAGGAVELQVSGTVHLPLFGDVKFTGKIDNAGNLSLSTPMPDFSLPGGFIKFSGGVLTLHPDRIHVEVDLSISQLADAHFTGDIHADGTYELTASAKLNIAGFEIPIPSAGPNLRLVNGQLDIGFDYGIPGLDEFLPAGDASVSFSGTYSLDGSFSLTATAHYKFTIGPVVVNEEFITLTNTSLTLGARGSIADLGPLAEGEVSMTIYKDGSFHAVVTVDSSIAGFDLGNAEVTFGNHNPDKLLISTLHAQMSVPTMVPSNILIDGYWDANGNYDFKGTSDVILGGLTLAQAQFAVSKVDGVTFSASVDFVVMQATISGTITPDDAGGFTTTTDVVGSILRGPHLELHGTFDSHGNYNFTGESDIAIGPLTLSQTSFTLNNVTGLTFSDSWNFGVFSSTVTGTFRAEGGGFSITVDATGTVFGQPLVLHGDVHSNGRFDLSGTAVVGLSLFGTSATFDLSNRTGSTVFMFTTGFSFGPFAAAAATGTIVGNPQNYDVTIDARGSVFGQSLTLHGDLHKDGKFDLSGTANVGLQPLLGTSSTFSLSNKTGSNFFKFSGGWHFGPFDAAMTGTITGTSQTFVVGFEAVGRVFGQALTLKGDIKSNGKFDLAGSAKVGLAPLFGTTATFGLSNLTGPTVFKFTGSWNIGPFSSSLTGTIVGTTVTVDAVGSIYGNSLTLHGDILGNGDFTLTGSAQVGLQPLVGSTATFDLSNRTGRQVFKFTGSWTVGAFSSANLSAEIITSSAGSNVKVTATGALLGNTIRLDGWIYSNGVFDISATNNVNFFGVSLSSVTIHVRSNSRFEIQARWGHSLFNGNLSGSIASNGRVQLNGNSQIGRAGFSINVAAAIDLNPSANSNVVSLKSNLDVYVATVAFEARAAWSGSSLPLLAFTGRAAIGGVLSGLLSGSADFTIGTNVVLFEGTLGIPRLSGVSLDVDASVSGDGTLHGLPGLGNIFSLGNLADLAASLWYDLGATWADAARGLNQAFGIADREVARLLRDAEASAGELQEALSSAFNWSDRQVSGFLSSVGGVVGGGSVGGFISGATGFSLGIPAGSLVFFDANKNGTLDEDEPWGYTTSQGEITFQIPLTFDTNANGTLDDAEGQWVARGGIDLTTGLVPAMDTITPASWPMASPLTTLVSALLTTGVPIATAKSKVLTALSLPPAIELSTFDPVPAVLASQANGRLVENAHAQIENTVALIAALFRSPFDLPASSTLTSKIVNELAQLIDDATGTVDLSNVATITQLIHASESATGISLSASLVDGAATVVANCNQQFASIPAGTGLPYLESVAQIKSYVQSTVADDLARAANGQMTINAVVAKDTGTSLSNAIAAVITAPTILVPIHFTAPATSPNGAAVSFHVEAFDLAGQSLAVTTNILSGAQFSIGVTTVTAQTTDSLGNPAVATFTVTVADITAPSLTLPANLTVQANALGGANVTLPVATATDSVDPNPSVMASMASGFFGLGVTAITVTATDSAGNTTTGVFTVTVLDTTAPTITPPGNLTVEANFPGGGLVDLPRVIVSDAADPAPLTTLDLSSGFFPIGTTLVHIEVIDASGNTATASFNVTVVDGTGPSLVLPADLVIEANAIGGATITLPDAFATDDADENPAVSIDAADDFFPLGTTTVHVTTTDAEGNTTTGSYTVTVVDTTAPTLVLPQNLEIQADTIGGAVVTLPGVSVTDNADASPTVTIDHVSGFLPLGTTVVTVVAVDAAGNRSSGSYTVTVVNTVAPTFNPAPSSLRGGPPAQGFGSFAGLAEDSNPLSGYNMRVEAGTRGGAFVTLPSISATATSDASPLVRFDHSSGFFPVGVTVVTVTATDSSGNQTSGTFTVTVEDGTAPELTAPNNVVIEASVAGGGAQVTLPTAFALDIVDPNPTVTYSHPSGFFPMGTTTVQVTAKDAAGNSITRSFNVTVVDTTPPAITQPANIVVTASSVAGAQVTFPQAVVSDLVDAHPTLSYNPPAGQFSIGTTLVTLRATDASGNTSLSTFSVTVNQVATTVTLQSNSPATSTYGALLQFTVLVSATGGATVPDGEVVYLQDTSHQNTVVATGVVLNGSAVISVSKLNVGAHNLRAAYLGNGSYGSGQSATLNRSVTPRSLSVRAISNTKGYDGTTSSSSSPIVIGLQDGDSINGLRQSYADSAIGFGKTLIPSGTVNDGNGGQNYAISYVNNATGVISISVDALGNTVNNIQPTFTGTGSTASGSSNTVMVKVYSGPVASGTPVLSLQTTLADGAFEIEALSNLTPDGIYTAQAIQSAGSGRSFVSNSMTFVVDSTPPVLSLPGSQSLRSVKPAGVTDNPAFTATATDALSASPNLTYKVGTNPISPDFVFPVGTTIVTVTATDAAGNHISGNILVTVVSSTSVKQTFNAGANAVLHATPPGIGDRIQWQSSQDGIHFTNIAGADDSAYEFNANVTQNGSFYRALFSSPSGTTSNTPIELTVIERPEVLDAVFMLPENSATGTIAGTVIGSVPNDTLTYTIIDGNSSGAFAINGVTGKITIANPAQFDFETHPVWTLTVQGTDTHGQSDVATVTVNLTDVNEAPVVSSGLSLSIIENSPAGTNVGTVTASDPDFGNTLTYSITGGNIADAFAINPTTGAITVANASALDFETTPAFALTVQVIDNHGAARTANVTIAVTPLIQPPQLNLGGTAVTWIGKQPAVTVLPQISVGGSTALSGGTLTIKVNAVGTAKKLLDQFRLPSFAAIGTSSGPQFANGHLNLQIQLGANATNATIQSFLRGISFSTKGKGLKTPTRTLNVNLTVGGQSSAVLQTINVHKKG